jgi:hypothetical protein
MSRKGNYWDNACAESFFKTLKKEMDNLEGRVEVFEYMEMYYNKRRRHSALDYAVPAAVTPCNTACSIRLFHNHPYTASVLYGSLRCGGSRGRRPRSRNAFRISVLPVLIDRVRFLFPRLRSLMGTSGLYGPDLRLKSREPLSL